MKLIAIADSDSYLKWAAALLGTLPDDIEQELLLIDTPVLPSPSQRAAALAVGGHDVTTLRVLTLTELVQHVRQEAPDAVLVSTRGPVGAVLIRKIEELPNRPVVVTGLPGISIPATRKALYFRQQADLFLLHSRREIREFTRLSRDRDWSHRFALATLPFAQEHTGAGGTDLVFATQAIVPRTYDDRMQLLLVLVETARADPAKRVVIKVRALAGERQTHDEHLSFPELLEELDDVPPNVVVSAAPMSEALDSAEGLLTVSSTALIEAIARGIPVIALDTFGVTERLINTVFEGSGLLAGADAVIARDFRHPDPGWLDDNYFHSTDSEDFVPQLRALVAARANDVLPARPATQRLGGWLREAWDRKRAFGPADRSLSGLLAVLVGTPALAVLKAVRRARSRTGATVPTVDEVVAAETGSDELETAEVEAGGPA